MNIKHDQINKQNNTKACQNKITEISMKKRICLFICLLYFWGTCADCAVLLHRYTCAMVVDCITPSFTLGISPNAIPPKSPHPLLFFP